MSERDLATRKTAVPFTALPFGSQIGVENDQDAVQPVGWSDGESIAADALRVMRFARPDRGNLIQAYLNLVMTCSVALQAKVAVGRFDTDGVTAVTPTQGEIDAGHLALTGTTTPFTSSGGVLFIDGLNLLKQMALKGDANYNEDGFVLIVQFNRNLTTNDFPQRCEVSCSMQMGLL